MRKRSVSGELSLQAIAGTHVVLLGINLRAGECPGLLGFAIRRHDVTEGETYWLSGYKTFESVEPNPAPGVLYSTDRHPIQSFTWSDYSAKPEHDYEYEVVALRGSPSLPTQSERVKVALRTESAAIPGSIHHVHFNRGAAASQEYTRRFGDKRPDQVGSAAYDWLSRGAAEAIKGFIERATDKGWGLRICAYEFTDERVLQSLKDAWKGRKADVRVLYHAKNDSTKKGNVKAITAFGLDAICAERAARGLALSHNKVIVLTQGSKAKAVLTGSTNFSEGGIYGHSNVVHICEDETIAQKYLWLWNELEKNDDRKDAAPVIDAKSPLPAGNTVGTTPVFSPRDDLSALEWYAKQAMEGPGALFMTFAFGMNQLFQDAYRDGKARLRYALMEKMSGPTKTKAQTKANEQKIIALRKMEENKFAVGAALEEGAFGHWLAEKLTGLNVHVRYLHEKFMLVDPLGDNPLVVTGSANFSDASTTNNDENMLVIRGDKRVAEIYLGEFMRMYSHFAFRDWLSSHPKAKSLEAEVNHLDETDTWWKIYFGTSFAARQREYFAG